VAGRTFKISCYALLKQIVQCLLCSLVLLWRNDIVDLEDHLDHLRRELELLLLGHDGLKDTLLAHVRRALMVCVDAHEWVLCVDLFFAQLAHVFDGVVAGVLCQSKRDLL